MGGGGRAGRLYRLGRVLRWQGGKLYIGNIGNKAQYRACRWDRGRGGQGGCIVYCLQVQAQKTCVDVRVGEDIAAKWLDMLVFSPIRKQVMGEN